MLIHGALYYDLKRGLVRLSVITVLVLFVLLGVGVVYMASANLASGGVETEGILIITVDPGIGVARVEGYVFTPTPEGLSNVRGSLSCRIRCGQTGADHTLGDVVASLEKDFNGFFKSETRLREEVIENLKYGVYECSAEYTLSTPFWVKITTLNLVKINTSSGRSLYHVVSGSPLILYRNPTTIVQLLVFRTERGAVFVVVVSNPVNPDEEVDIYIREDKPGETGTVQTVAPGNISGIEVEDLESQGFAKLGSFKHGISVVEGQVNSSLLHVVVVSGGTVENASFTVVPVSHVKQSLREAVVYALLASMSPFGALSPIVALYLVYVYIAKPRYQGALEFILARPVTRLGLFLTRLVAGILVVTVATTAFFLSIVVFVNILLNVVLDTYAGLLLYAALIIPLIAFYTLCYFLSTIASGTRYLVISIMVYLLFGIMFSLIVLLLAVAMRGGVWYGPGFQENFQRISYMTRHFNPLGFGDFAQFYILQYYGMIDDRTLQAIGDIVNPVLVAISTIVWITVPIVLGWLVFRRANLSR